MGKIFNIVGCSLALAGTFAANPVAHDVYRGLLPQLVNALRQAPRRVKIGNLRPYGGHCYMFDVLDKLPDDQTSASTIILFEDGASMKRPLDLDVDGLAAQGGAGCFHIQNYLVFSTHDNSSPLTNGRKYFAIHSLTRDVGLFARLAQWGRDTTATGAHRLFEMLSMLCPRHFTYGSLHTEGETVEMRDVSLALDHGATLRMTAAAVTVRPMEPGSPIQLVSIRDIAPVTAPTERWSIEIAVNVAPNPAVLLPALRITGPGGLDLGYQIGRRAVFHARRLRALRALMLPWFTDAAGVHAWLGEMADFLCIPLDEGGLGLTPDAESTAAFRNLLSEGAIDDGAAWVVTSAEGQRLVALEAGAA